MKKFLLLILFVGIYINSFGQTGLILQPQSCPASNSTLNYWYYRDRLKYFVIPGYNQGESEIFGTRNDWAAFNWQNDPLHKGSTIFGNPMINFGQYLGVLATEYSLLYRNQQYPGATNTLKEIDEALYQLIHYLEESPYYGDNNQLTGFFVRENVPCDFIDSTTTLGNQHLNLLNKNLILITI